MNDIDKIQWKVSPDSHKHSDKDLCREFNFSELCYLEDGLKTLMEAHDWAFNSPDIQQLFLDIRFARMLEKNRSRTGRDSAGVTPHWRMLVKSADGQHFFMLDTKRYAEPDTEAEECVRLRMKEGETLLWVSDRWEKIREELMENEFSHAWEYFAACARLVEHNNRRRRLTEAGEV